MVHFHVFCAQPIKFEIFLFSALERVNASTFSGAYPAQQNSTDALTKFTEANPTNFTGEYFLISRVQAVSFLFHNFQ